MSRKIASLSFLGANMNSLDGPAHYDPSAGAGGSLHPRIDPKTEIRVFELDPPRTITQLSSDAGSDSSDWEDASSWEDASGWDDESDWDDASDSEDRNLKGRFIVAKLADMPEYEALSYAWGPPIFNDTIEITGRAFQITSHLGTALRHLRRTHISRRLWVDAICIDQSDDSEKGHQVSLMTQIYQHTKGVLAWLGPGSVETEAACSFLDFVSTSTREHGIDLNPLGANVSTENDSELAWAPFRGLSGDTCDYMRTESHAVHDTLTLSYFTKILESFFSQEWFQRLWIVQEMALPSQLTLMNGTRKLSSTALITSMTVLNRRIDRAMLPSLWVLTLPLNFRDVFDLVRVRAATQNNHGTQYDETQILGLVVNNHSRKCKEPKDRIYSLLGLQGSSIGPGIMVDYSLSNGQVFQTFAVEHFRRGILLPLHYSGLISHVLSCDHKKWPSWAPDWTCNKQRVDARIGHPMGAKPFATCTNSAVDINLARIDEILIGVPGKILDVVKRRISSNRAARKRDNKDCEALVDTITRWKDNYMRSYTEDSNYHTGEGFESVFARTLVLNNRDKQFYSIQEEKYLKPGDRDQILRCLRALITRNQASNNRLPGWVAVQNSNAGAAYLQDVAEKTSNRELFTTEDGYLGLGPIPLEPGDRIVIFNGAETPFVLRQFQRRQSFDAVQKSSVSHEEILDARWQLVGDCYLHGFMNNEILGPGFKDKEQQMFWIE